MLSLSDALANLSNLPMISNMMSGDFFTARVMNNIWSFIWFVVAYAIVFIIIPAKVLKLKLCDGNFIDNAMISITISQVTLISIVFVLAFMKIYNTTSLVLSIIFVILFYVKFKNRISFREKLRDFIFAFSDVVTGQLKLSLIIRNYLREKISNISHGVKRFATWYFDKNAGFHIVGTLCVLVLCIRRGFFAIISQGFPTSDVTVHTSWVNFTDAGYIFSDGIYPFALHNIVSAMARITFIDVVTIMRFMGPLNAIFMGLLLMIFITRIFKSPAASIITAMVYCLSSFGSGAVIDRIYFTLPQEYGMMYILPAGYFMIKFLEEQRTIDGITFSFAASMTVAAHFYDAIFSVPLCFCLVIPYFTFLFKKKVFLKMVLSVMLAAVVALGPMFVGLALGYHWQGSLDWAISMMSLGSDDGGGDQGGEYQGEEQQEEQQQEEQQEGEQQEGEQQEGQEEDGQQTPAPQSSPDDGGWEQYEEYHEPNFIEKSIQSFGWTMESYTDFWGYVVGACVVGSFALGGVALFTSKKKQGRVAIGLGLNMVMFNYVLLHPNYFGLPSFIGGDRALNYLIYFGALMIGVPFGVFWSFFEERVKPVRWVASVAIVLATAYLIVFTGTTFRTSAYYRMSYSAVTENYYKIKATHRKDTWTIVSTVDELSLTRNKGWHYELWEFIFRMEQYEPTRVVQIPTEYVYFVVEKRPLRYNEPTYLGAPLALNPRISKAAANQLVTEQIWPTNKKSDYYGDYDKRVAVMSKAYFWAEKYMSYFPDQMTVYYEDMDIIIYEIKQNMYALNNFAIDYGYNTITMEDWLKEHPEAIGMFGDQTQPTVSDSDLVAEEDGE